MRQKWSGRMNFSYIYSLVATGNTPLNKNLSNTEWDKDWLHFSKSARRGLFVLLGIFIVIAVLPRLYYNYFYQPPNYNITTTSFPSIEKQKSNKQKKYNSEDKKEKESHYTAPKEKFNPNKYSVADWMKIGLTKAQAQTILNYLKTGARFHKKSDLKTLYVMNAKLYATIEAKIDLPNMESISLTQSKTNKDTTLIAENKLIDSEPQPVSINSATQKELERIKGIGPFFASEIIKMRKDFGGIISAQQLLSIYKMDKEKLAKITPYLIIDSREVNKINVNTATYATLIHHPWISVDMAKSIIYYRENYKLYQSLDELLLSPYINTEVLNKLKPYIKVK